MEGGKVYVVHNEWLQDPESGEMPYKIGITKNSVDDRYYGLGLKMPGEFVCDFAYEFEDKYSMVENAIHDILNKLRINGEWFYVDERTLEGVRKICELAGGKLITEKIEKKMEAVNGIIINQKFEKIINKWNSFSELKAYSNSSKKKSIHIPGFHKSVYYVFRIRNQKEISIELACFTKSISDFDVVLKSFDGLNINNNIFNYPPLTAKETKNGWKGRIRTIISIDEIDNIINTMKMLIENTKEKVIEKCNEEKA